MTMWKVIPHTGVLRVHITVAIHHVLCFKSVSDMNGGSAGTMLRLIKVTGMLSQGRPMSLLGRMLVYPRGV